MIPLESPASEGEATAPAGARRDRGIRRRLPEGWLLALLLLAGLTLLKLEFDPGLGRNFLDGNFYFQIAQNVSAGDGLTTRVSLYHQGLKSLPHPTNMAPVWPLALAAAGRIADLPAAAETLPELLYLVGLWLLFSLVERLAARFDEAPPDGRQAPFWRHALSPRPGHAMVALFGANPIFFEFTSVPYTEALSFALILAGLVLVDCFDFRPGPLTATGVWCLASLAILTRGQLLGFACALALVPLLAAARGRVRLRALLLPAAAALAPLVAWTTWLATWARPWSFRYLIAPASYRETPELAPFQQRVLIEGVFARLADFLHGLGVAFSMSNPDGYAASFGVAVLIPALALLLVVRRPAAVRRWLARLGAPGTLLSAATLVSAVGLLAPLHVFHARFFREWLFGFRHGLPFVLVIAMGAALIAARGGRLVRATSLVLVLAAALQGVPGVVKILGTRYAVGLAGQEVMAFEWIAASGAQGSLVTTAAQSLAPYSPRGLHWMECREPGSQTLALLRHAGARYLLVYPGEERCRFFRQAQAELRRAAVFGAAGRQLEIYEIADPAEAEESL